MTMTHVTYLTAEFDVSVIARRPISTRKVWDSFFATRQFPFCSTTANVEERPTVWWWWWCCCCKVCICCSCSRRLKRPSYYGLAQWLQWATSTLGRCLKEIRFSVIIDGRFIRWLGFQGHVWLNGSNAISCSSPAAHSFRMSGLH